MDLIGYLETTAATLHNNLAEWEQVQVYKRDVHMNCDYCCWVVSPSMPYLLHDYHEDLSFSRTFIEANPPPHIFLGN